METHRLERLRLQIGNEYIRSGIPQARWTVEAYSVPNAARGIVSAVKRLFGVDVRFVRANGIDPRLQFDGIYIGRNTVYVNVDSSTPFSSVSQSATPAINPHTQSTLTRSIDSAFGNGFTERLKGTEKFRFITSDMLEEALDGAKFSKASGEFRAPEVRDAQGRLLAPNGEVSKLNERQWHQVRSPEFKNWFGDWESLDTQSRFDAFVEKAISDKDPRNEFVVRKVTDEEAKEVLAQSGIDISGMDHIVSAEYIKHAHRQHGSIEEFDKEQGKQRQLTTQDLQRILAVIDGYDAITVQQRAHNKSSIIYSKKFDDGTVEYVERVIETSAKHKPRLVTKTAWVKTPIGVEANLPRVYAPERNTSLPFSAGRINPDSISKVVDPETGEPMVVYHGTNSDFTVFKSWSNVHWFTGTSGDAGSQGKNVRGGSA